MTKTREWLTLCINFWSTAICWSNEDNFFSISIHFLICIWGKCNHDFDNRYISITNLFINMIGHQRSIVLLWVHMKGHHPVAVVYGGKYFVTFNLYNRRWQARYTIGPLLALPFPGYIFLLAWHLAVLACSSCPTKKVSEKSRMEKKK